MPLPKQTVNIPFVGGIDTKTDPKQVQPIRLLNLENAHFNTLQQLSKRNGFSPTFYNIVAGVPVEFQDNDAIVEAGSCFTKDDHLLLNARQTWVASGRTSEGDGWRFYDLIEQTDEWKDVGVLEPLGIDVFPAIEATDWIWRTDGSKYLANVDVARCNGYYCFVCTYVVDPFAVNRRMVRFTVMDAQTKTIIYDRRVASLSTHDASYPHVVAVGDSFHIWYGDTNNNRTYLLIIDTTNLEVVAASATQKETDYHADDLIDVTIANDSGGFGWCSVVAYKETVAGHIRVRWYDEGGTLRYNILLTEVPINALSCQRLYNAGAAVYTICVTYQENASGGDTRYAMRNEDSTLYLVFQQLTATTAAKVVRNITCTEDESRNAFAPAISTIRWYLEIDNNPVPTPPTVAQPVPAPASQPSFNYVLQCVDNFSGTVPADLDILRNCGLASKAFYHGGKGRCWLAYNSAMHATPAEGNQLPQLQHSLFLTQARTSTPDARYDARVLYMNGNGLTEKMGLPQVVTDVGSDVFVTASVRQERLEADGDIFRSCVGVEVRFHGGDYDYNALDRNDLGPTKTIAAGGYIGDFDTGKFAELNFHLFPEPCYGDRGATAGATFPGTDTTYYYKIHYEWIDKTGQIHRSATNEFAVYIDGAGGGNRHPILYVPCLHKGEIDKLDDVKIAIFRLWTDGLFHRLANFVLNDLTLAFVTVNDLVYDISANEILYTEGGILDDYMPPCSRILTVRQNRAFVVPEEDRELIWFSKEKVHGNGIQFSPFLTKRISAGGDITALAELDEKVIVFKTGEIHAFTGRGPNEFGTGQDFTESYQITSDVGCIDRRSIVKTDEGLLFKSKAGIYLLNRGLQTSYVGAPVESYNDVAVHKARLVDHLDQVRFLLRDGTILVYDYLVKQWSTFVNGTWGLDYLQDAVIYNNKFYFLNETAFFNEESTLSFVDNTAYVPMVIDTAWYKMADLQGYQRIDWISLLGEWKSAHTLSVDVYVNYETTASYTKTLTANAAFGALVPYQFRFKPGPGTGKCQAIRFKIYDSGTVGPGSEEGLSLSGIAFDYKVKKGLYKQATAKTL